MSGSKQIVQEWFEVWEAEPGVHVIAEPFHVEEVRSYLVVGDERAVLIDTGMGVADIRAVVSEITSLPVTLINSHAHWDHVGGNWQFDQICIHESEARDLERTRAVQELAKWFTPDHLLGPLPAGIAERGVEIKASSATTLLYGGEIIQLGGRSLEVMHTPGHSPGGIVLIDRGNRCLFSTDVAYRGALYAYSPTTNVIDYRDTLKRLETVAAEMLNAYPSHGATPIDPAVIHDMRVAFDLIIEGKAPDQQISPEMAKHEFGVFSVLVPASYSVGAGLS